MGLGGAGVRLGELLAELCVLESASIGRRAAWGVAVLRGGGAGEVIDLDVKHGIACG